MYVAIAIALIFSVISVMAEDNLLITGDDPHHFDVVVLVTHSQPGPATHIYEYSLVWQGINPGDVMHFAVGGAGIYKAEASTGWKVVNVAPKAVIFESTSSLAVRPVLKVYSTQGPGEVLAIASLNYGPKYTGKITGPIPEFTTIAIPIAGILGLLFLFNRRKRRKEQ